MNNTVQLPPPDHDFITYELKEIAVIDHNSQPPPNTFPFSYSPSLKSSTVLEINPPVVNCIICLSDIQTPQVFTLVTCSHTFCTDCVKLYIENLMQTEIPNLIYCPNLDCKSTISDPDIEKLLGVEKFETLKHSQKMAALNRDPDVRFCINVNCSKILKGGKGKSKLICECGEEMCFNCRGKWHPGKTCEQVIDEEYGRSRNRPKLCPMCRYRSIKEAGCDYIRCPNCKFEYCWKCMGAYGALHNCKFEFDQFRTQRTVIGMFIYFFLTILTKILLMIQYIIAAAFLYAIYLHIFVLYDVNRAILKSVQKRVNVSVGSLRCIMGFVLVLLYPVSLVIFLMLNVFRGCWEINMVKEVNKDIMRMFRKSRPMMYHGQRYHVFEIGLGVMFSISAYFFFAYVIMYSQSDKK